MPLPTREELAKHLLDGAEKHFESRVVQLGADVENLIAFSVGIDDHQHIDNALVDLFTKLSAEHDNLEAVREFRKSKGL